MSLSFYLFGTFSFKSLFQGQAVPFPLLGSPGWKWDPVADVGHLSSAAAPSPLIGNEMSIKAWTSQLS